MLTVFGRLGQEKLWGRSVRCPGYPQKKSEWETGKGGLLRNLKHHAGEAGAALAGCAVDVAFFVERDTRLGSDAIRPGEAVQTSICRPAWASS